jgi:hypothetical protein
MPDVRPLIERNPQVVTLRDDLEPPLPIDVPLGVDPDPWSTTIAAGAPSWFGEGDRCPATKGSYQCALQVHSSQWPHSVNMSSV